MNEYGLPLGKNIRVIDPVGYFTMILLLAKARMLLTDSGGMQKEAYWLRVPCITLRDETEWVETVNAGWNVLVGSSYEKITAAVANWKTSQDHPILYGDGKASQRIVSLLSG